MKRLPNVFSLPIFSAVVSFYQWMQMVTCPTTSVRMKSRSILSNLKWQSEVGIYFVFSYYSITALAWRGHYHQGNPWKALLCLPEVRGRLTGWLFPISCHWRTLLYCCVPLPTKLWQCFGGYVIGNKTNVEPPPSSDRWRGSPSLLIECQHSWCTGHYRAR